MQKVTRDLPDLTLPPSCLNWRRLAWFELHFGVWCESTPLSLSHNQAILTMESYRGFWSKNIGVNK